MRIPGTPSLFFLLYLLVLLPWLAIRSAQILRARRSAGSTPAIGSRSGLWIQTIIMMALLFGMSWAVGHTFGYHIFALPSVGVREMLAAFVALALLLLLRVGLRRTRTEAERRQMLVYQLAPQNPREWTLSSLAVLGAGLAEEAAYRGVGMSILWYALGSPWPAVLVCAIAFALAHWSQGWKSVAVIFLIALVAHALVWFTHTLVLMMIVHAAYDFIAGYLIARDAPKYRPA